MAEEEKKISVEQNIRYQDNESQWKWATPITIYEDGSIQLNGNLANEIDADTLLPDYSLTNVKMYDGADENRIIPKKNDSRYAEFNSQRPVATNNIQDYAVTEDKIANSAIQNGHLYGSQNNENNDDLKPVTTGTIQNEAVTGEKVANITIPLKKLSQPFFVVTQDQGIARLSEDVLEFIENKESNFFPEYKEGETNSLTNHFISLYENISSKIQSPKTNDNEDSRYGTYIWDDIDS